MTQHKPDTAEGRFRDAYDRLKAGKPVVVPPGTPVSQNNVAREAGTDPTALKKERFPALIRDIQVFVEIADQERAAKVQRAARRTRLKEDLKTRVKTLQAQRDHAQSQLGGAHRRLVELLRENAALAARLDALLPPPTPLRK